MLRDPEVKTHHIPLERFDQVSREFRAPKNHPNNTSLVGYQLIDCGHFDANRLISFSSHVSFTVPFSIKRSGHFLPKLIEE